MRTLCVVALVAPVVVGPVVGPPTARAAVTGATRLTNAGQTVLFGAADPTDPGQMLLAGRGGSILRLDLAAGSVAAAPYLTIPGVATNGEGGLLGLALDPDYANNGFGYVYYTSLRGTNALRSNIARFQRDPTDPTRALASSLTPILSFDQPQTNHNGGWIGFSPTDGYLYIASGDGGASDDSGTGHTAGTGNAQDTTGNLLGKMLRLDVRGDDFPTDPNRNYAIPLTNPFAGVTGDDEIWSYGLRNPFRSGFDRETGDLWIADVGQNTREEINFQPAGRGGDNYGWRLREGTVATPSGGVGGPRPADNVEPIYEYLHPDQPGAVTAFAGNSVTGGVPYRGNDPSLQGHYFFADFATSRYWRRSPTGVVTNINTALFGSGGVAGNPVAFVEDIAGELYFLTIGGDIWRINTAAPGDFNGDGLVNTSDYDAWATAYGTVGDSPADGNADGRVDAADYTLWRDNAGGAAADSTATPEPAGLALAALSAAAASSVRRRRAVRE